MNTSPASDAVEANARIALEQWYARTSIVAVGHYRAALRYTRLHYWLSVPTTALAAIVGTSVFASLGQQPEYWWRVIVGAMSILAAILSALQSSLRYNELAERHRAAGAKYNSLGRQLEIVLADAVVSHDVLSILVQRIDALAGESPHIPQAVHAHMTKKDSVSKWGET